MKHNIRHYYIGLLCAAFMMTSQKVWAHPVTFEGGTVVMAEMSGPFQSYSAAYSPKWWLGVGAHTEVFDQTRLYSSFHFGLLLKRWNMEEAQGNLYILGGPGYYNERVQGQVLDEGGFTRMGVQADFETRRFYSNIRYTERRTFDGFEALDNLVDAAIGFAPYLAGYTELNSWFILRYMDGNRLQQPMLIPMTKFFYKNYLWELGVSTRGEAMVNIMVHL